MFVFSVEFLWGTLEQIIKPENFFTFPSVSGPIWRSAPRARCLDQPDGGRWYWNHSTVKPLSIRLLLVQSPGYQSRWRQPTKPALKPIQDQPCRWYTWSPSRKKKSCNVYFENSHWLNHILGFFLAPDENPSDVQGVGTEPGNLVISWTVSYIFVSLAITYCRCFILKCVQ